MSYKLVAEVLDHAPVMTPVEVLVLVAIAERTRDPDGESATVSTVDIAASEMTRRTRVTGSAVRHAILRLAERGIDVRVPLRYLDDGKPLFTVPGRVPTYRLPRFRAPADCPCQTCSKAVPQPPLPANQQVSEGVNVFTPPFVGVNTVPPGVNTFTEGVNSFTAGVNTFTPTRTVNNPDHPAAADESTSEQPTPSATADRIAGEVARLRPEWNLGWIREAINKALAAGKPLDVIAVAFPRYGLDAGNRSPGGLTRPGPWWPAAAPMRQHPQEIVRCRVHELQTHGGICRGCEADRKAGDAA